MEKQKVKANNQLSGYELSRNWFDWCYENPDLINPTHAALYFFIIEHYNRLGWKEKFGLPYQMAMDAIGIKSYKTYKKAFDDLADWGFIKIITASKNQYSANVIALVKNTKANTKALTKASLKHSLKHVQGTGDIDKPNNQELNNQEPLGANAPPKKKNRCFWKNFIAVFEKFYLEKVQAEVPEIKREKYKYQKKDWGCIEKIYDFLKERADSKSTEWTEEYMKESFDFFLNKAWQKDDWLKKNFSIPNLLSQFNQIIKESSNGSINGRAVTATGKELNGSKHSAGANKLADQLKSNLTGLAGGR